MSRFLHPAPSHLLAALLLIVATACCTAEADTSTTASGDPADPHPGITAAANAPTAKVLQTMNSGGYTYVELDVAGAPTWFAGSETQVAVGDTLVVPSREMAMHDFHAASLDRTFGVIYFVQSFKKVGAPAVDREKTVQQAHQQAAERIGAASPQPAVDLAGIEKPDGGATVAELFARGKDGAGEDVVLRGRVVKFNANILGKNWLHVRDGSGADGTNDITITTTDTAAVGDLVLVRGKLAADRDLGAGYHFDLMIEDAAVTIE